MEAEVLKALIAAMTAAGFGIAIAAVGCGLAMGLGLKAAVTGIARNPEASGKIMTTMLIGLALIESLAIYTLVVALLLIFVAPQGVSFTGLLGQ
jgi:F-type H+-transporting ATPase subunit c